MQVGARRPPPRTRRRCGRQCDEYVWFIAVPICTTLGFIVLKTDDLATRLSIPFGEGSHDLPLETICAKIEAVVFEVASHAASEWGGQ